MWHVQVDTMIVQAIGLLDDLDKELNTYAMRVREWFGWHFPEMTKIVTDNIAYAKVVRPPPRPAQGSAAAGTVPPLQACVGHLCILFLPRVWCCAHIVGA